MRTLNGRQRGVENIVHEIMAGNLTNLKKETCPGTGTTEDPK